jgi:hypothetical protein
VGGNYVGHPVVRASVHSRDGCRRQRLDGAVVRRHGERKNVVDQAGDTDGLAAWDSVYSVLTYPRCINCHTATNYPEQGDQRRRHFANVIRGPEGIAARDHLTILDEPASHPHIETMMLANGDC